MKKWIVFGMVLCACLFITGCVKTIDEQTGETTYGIAPAYAEKVDAIATGVEETVPPAVAMVSAVSPTAAPIASGVGGILLTLVACWRKWRTPLIETKDTKDKIALGSSVAADVINELVKSNPKLWEKAKPVLRAAEASGAIMPDKVKK